jgi:DNA-binding MarR family transcriptional regulator
MIYFNEQDGGHMTTTSRRHAAAARGATSAAKHAAAVEPRESEARDVAVGAVIDSVRAIVRTLRVSGRAAEQTVGLHGAQLFVLQKLAEGPAQSLAELAGRTHTDPSSVSVVVSRLVARRLVSRTVSPEDARRVVIALTPAGRATLRRAPEAAQAQLIGAAERLPRRDLLALAAGLKRLVSKLPSADGASD